MKKRLLFAFMAMCASVSSFALSQGEFVYTPQGRFQITGANLNANNAFQSLDGWTVRSASEEKTLADNINITADGYAAGMNSVVSLDGTNTEGMYYKFVPTDAGSTYVVSFKMKSTEAHLTTVANSIAWDGSGNEVGDVLTKCVKVRGNSTGTIDGTDDEVLLNKAEELTEEWQTFNYAIQGDGTARTYFIELRGLPNSVEFADLQIAPALQYADLRQRDAMIEKMNTYKNCYGWSQEVLDDMGYDEAIATLQAIGDESGQGELDGALATAEEVVTEFIKANMDDYLAGGTKDYNYLGVGVDKMQKVSTIGIWNCLPSGRAHWTVGDYPDMGHFQNGNTWNNGAPTTAMGVNTQKELDPGSYVFGIEGLAALRVEYSKTWVNDDGKDPAYGVAYIAKVVDGNVTDTVAVVTKDLSSAFYTPFFVTVKIEEAGKYELGFNIFCKEDYQALKLGSVSYVRNASIFGKNENKYNQKQLTYEANVRTQITTGRDNITTALGYLDDASYAWGKDALKAVVDEVEPKIMEYEAMSQDEIIATYDEDVYVNTTSEETGLLQYTVYQEATKLIIAANREFVAENDTLNSLQKAIEGAESTLALRVYSAATGKADLQAAIAKAKDLQTQMKASQYSEENAAAIVAANEELAEAVAAFKNSIPASAIATLVDIDFEADAVQNEETQLYSITGAAGVMEFSNFALDVTDAYPYQQGIWNNGEQQYKGYVRVGNGTGTVEFDPTVGGEMGTNILKVNCDLFLQGLSGKFVGFYLKNDADSIVAGYYANYYDNKIDDSSNLPVELGNLKYGSGSSYANRPPQGAEGAEGVVLAKNSFEVILDFGEGTIYCTTTSDKGVATTAKQAFDKSVPVKFVLQSNYINNDRRIWFDNLKIERISTDGVVDGIVDVNAADVKAPTKVLKNGRIVINGKYGVNGMLVK